jgi:Flp pilus assembly protein TadD
MKPPRLLVVAILMSSYGCAGWKGLRSAPGTVTPQREERQAETVRDFEDRRDNAQLRAALDRWQQGDAAGCEAMLTAIVKRRPDYTDARLQLGQVLLARGDAADAEVHLRAVLEQQPELAEAHHALALALDATGRSAEASQHLAKAAELEPDNEVYQLTAEFTGER